MTAPRVELAHLPTPFEAMPRLTAALGGPSLYVKRDDCTGLALGGNKARKLEWLAAEALSRGCDVLVTGGGPQSNHVRMTGATANRLGVACHVALAGDRADAPSGNLLVDELLGVHLHYTGPADYYELESAIESLAADLARDGHRPYAIPVGGASVTGVLAYADAADELRGQCRDAGVAIGTVVVAHRRCSASTSGRAPTWTTSCPAWRLRPRRARDGRPRRRAPTSTTTASGPGTAR